MIKTFVIYVLLIGLINIHIIPSSYMKLSSPVVVFITIFNFKIIPSDGMFCSKLEHAVLKNVVD